MGKGKGALLYKQAQGQKWEVTADRMTTQEGLKPQQPGTDTPSYLRKPLCCIGTIAQQHAMLRAYRDEPASSTLCAPCVVFKRWESIPMHGGMVTCPETTGKTDRFNCVHRSDSHTQKKSSKREQGQQPMGKISFPICDRQTVNIIT